jgi:hypothetical protein
MASTSARASLWLLLAALAACRADGPLLSDVAIEPAAITPDGDGDRDVARISYTVGRPAEVSIALVGPDGETHRLRDAQRRSPKAYEALFGGVVDGRMLADGSYTVRISATELEGETTATEERTLSLQGGDVQPPALQGFTVHPDVFSPNQDGLDDEVQIRYLLAEPAEVRLWMETEDGQYVTDILEESERGDRPGEPGLLHHYRFDAGVQADAPPPEDGPYRVVAEARDPSGNVVRETRPLTIEHGGQPEAAFVGDVEWSDTVVPLGSTLTFTVTVRNVSGTAVRTRGPEPGFVYDNTETFNQTAPATFLVLARDGDRSATRYLPAAPTASVDVDLADGAGAPPSRSARAAGTREAAAPRERTDVCGQVLDGGRPVAGTDVYLFEGDGDNGMHLAADTDGRYCFRDVPVPGPDELTFARSPGAVRLGLEYDEDRTGLGYPFRWQLGRTVDLAVCDAAERLYLCLPPGATVTVTGGLRFVEPPFRRGTNAWLSLDHEDVRIMDGNYGVQRITVEH